MTLQFDFDTHMETSKIRGRARQRKKLRIPEGTPLFVAQANFAPTEKFCVLEDKTISPLLEPNMVVGW